MFKEIDEKVYYKTNNEKSRYKVIEFDVDGVQGKFTIDKSIPLFAESIRPRIFEDLILPKDKLKELKALTKKDTVQILLHSTNPGLGKDSIISVLQNEMNLSITKYSAADRGGIAELRAFTKEFVANKSTFGDNRSKSLYLSETGEIAMKTLDSFKDFVEKYSSDFSFLITTNSMSNISKPFKDRFDVISFDNMTIDVEAMKALFYRLKAIMLYRDIKFEDNDLKRLIKEEYPSIRTIVRQIDRNTIDNRFEYKEDDHSFELLQKWVKAINNESYNDIVVISKQIQPEFIIRFFIKTNPLEVLQNDVNISLFLQILAVFNRDIVNNAGAFQYVSLLSFSNELIKAKIKIVE